MTVPRRFVATDGEAVVTHVKSVEVCKGVGEIFDLGEEVMNYKTDLDEVVRVSAPCLMKLLEVIRDDGTIDGGCLFEYEDLSQETRGLEGGEVEPAKVVTTSTSGLQGRESESRKVEKSLEAKATDVTMETKMLFKPRRAGKRFEAKAIQQAKEAKEAKAKDDMVYPHRRQYFVRQTDIEAIQSIIESGGDEEVRELKADFEAQVEAFKGLKLNVQHLDAKAGMPKALKMVLTGPRELFSGVDDWFKSNFTDFNVSEINLRDAEQKFREIQKMKDAQATSAQIVSVMSQHMPEGRKRALFWKLEDENKEIYVKRGRGKKWEDAAKAVGRIYYYSVLFVFCVFMVLSRVRQYLELWTESILRLLRVESSV